jgi:hypothetical protein
MLRVGKSNQFDPWEHFTMAKQASAHFLRPGKSDRCCLPLAAIPALPPRKAVPGPWQ